MGYLDEVREKFSAFISRLAPSGKAFHDLYEQLYMPASYIVTFNDKCTLRGMNAYVIKALSTVTWAFPHFCPRVKFHKDPVAVRPVISKRGSPSITLGKVIISCLSKIM